MTTMRGSVNTRRLTGSMFFLVMRTFKTCSLGSFPGYRTALTALPIPSQDPRMTEGVSSRPLVFSPLPRPRHLPVRSLYL